ncbi:winged helix-turn-helix domain-containing protein [Aeromonas veronii]|uniref:winged helix-turn-helix domain-containing protein n=1 Tax=Aeromonas TaxID=642 RepID=UPI0022EB0939|nr:MULTISPECIES: winged helix-turn-helix domain-containing protein [Aeromonas]KAJ8739022.1 winged helix-turn-helix domain-containing protein [Aeromonas veronii]MDA3318352.1 winged helix-turn-helix domain-containing protein [Aeromonas sp. PI_26]
MLELNTVSGELVWCGKPLARLSRSETLLLSHFIEHAELLRSQDDLLSAGWPKSIVAPNTLVVAIKNIRKNLSETGSSIETVHRRGYIFHPGKEAARIISSLTESCLEEPEMRSDTQDDTEAFDTTLIEDNVAIRGNEKISSDLQERVLASKKSNNHLFAKVRELSRFNLLRSLALKIFFYALSLVMLVVAIFVYDSTHEWYCYQVEDASVCGIFILDSAQQQVIKAELNGKSGEFLYGYENDLSKLKVYKIY